MSSAEKQNVVLTLECTLGEKICQFDPTANYDKIAGPISDGITYDLSFFSMIFIVFFLIYLIGSIPFGLILTKVFLKQDVRDIGSGNVGATNVLRTGNKLLALTTLVLDGLKGVASILFVFIIICYRDCELVFDSFSDDRIELLSLGLFAVIGHCFPVWLKFKGGKGVATTLGVLLAVVPITGLAAIGVWLVSFMAGRISSLAAITAMIVAPAVTYGVYGLEPAIVNVVISVLVIARHHSNIRRLMKGEESRFKSSKS